MSPDPFRYVGDMRVFLFSLFPMVHDKFFRWKNLHLISLTRWRKGCVMLHAMFGSAMIQLHRKLAGALCLQSTAR